MPRKKHHFFLMYLGNVILSDDTKYSGRPGNPREGGQKGGTNGREGGGEGGSRAKPGNQLVIYIILFFR